MDFADQDEHDLLEQLRANDDSAYEAMVRRFLPRLLIAARRILGNDADAADAVQDGFLLAFRNLASFDGSAKFSTWLHRVAVNAALMKLRSRNRRPEMSIDALLPKFQDDGHQLDPPAKWSENAVEQLERKEKRAMVREAIDRLPEMYRTVLLLRDIEEMDT
jgi:RNA polymerase sigma-70 factor (ECF subfamily)